tara:strand:+ start:334 stop:1263 length:930 start_codon:yes stop_codon:yes gene_type:complete
MGIKDFFQGNKEKRQERRDSYKKEKTDVYLPGEGRERTNVKVNRFKNEKSRQVDYDNGHTFTGTKKTRRKDIKQNETDFVTDSGLNTVKYNYSTKKGKHRSSTYEKNQTSQRTPYKESSSGPAYFGNMTHNASEDPEWYVENTLSGNVKKVTKNRRKTTTEEGTWSPEQGSWLNSKKVVKNPKNKNQGLNMTGKEKKSVGHFKKKESDDKINNKANSKKDKVQAKAEKKIEGTASGYEKSQIKKESLIKQKEIDKKARYKKAKTSGSYAVKTKSKKIVKSKGLSKNIKQQQENCTSGKPKCQSKKPGKV